jgi:hypothetical protein
MRAGREGIEGRKKGWVTSEMKSRVLWYQKSMTNFMGSKLKCYSTTHMTKDWVGVMERLLLLRMLTKRLLKWGGQRNMLRKGSNVKQFKNCQRVNGISLRRGHDGSI